MINTEAQTVQNILWRPFRVLKHVLSKSGDNSRLGKVVQMLNGRTSVQRNFEKLEGLSHQENLGNWARYKDLYLRWNNPVHLYVLGGDFVSSHL